MRMRKRGKIFFSGGGSEKISYLFDKEFVKSLPKGNVLYIPIAMDRDTPGYQACYDWITGALTQFDERFVDITMWLDLNGKGLSELRQFDAIYFGGGNTYRLLDKIYSSGFDKLIKDFIRGGGIYYGGSAGALILGKSIETVIEENDRNYKYSDGLGLVGNYSFVAHYNKDTKKKNIRIREFIQKTNSPVIAIPEGSGLIANGNLIQIKGEKPVTVFNLSEDKKILQVGEYFLLN